MLKVLDPPPRVSRDWLFSDQPVGGDATVLFFLQWIPAGFSGNEGNDESFPEKAFLRMYSSRKRAALLATTLDMVL